MNSIWLTQYKQTLLNQPMEQCTLQNSNKIPYFSLHISYLQFQKGKQIKNSEKIEGNSIGIKHFIIITFVKEFSICENDKF
jgi:hypothetical protein